MCCVCDQNYRSSVKPLEPVWPTEKLVMWWRQPIQPELSGSRTACGPVARRGGGERVCATVPGGPLLAEGLSWYLLQPVAGAEAAPGEGGQHCSHVHLPALPAEPSSVAGEASALEALSRRCQGRFAGGPVHSQKRGPWPSCSWLLQGRAGLGRLPWAEAWLHCQRPPVSACMRPALAPPASCSSCWDSSGPTCRYSVLQAVVTRVHLLGQLLPSLTPLMGAAGGLARAAAALLVSWSCLRGHRGRPHTCF